MSKDTVKETVLNTTDDKGQPLVIVTTSTFRMDFNGDTLTVSRVVIKEDEEEVTPIMVQPWKCLPNGSRENFSSAEDAYSWFENDIKPTIV